MPNVGMAPCESKGQPTFGISGSLKAAIERNVKVVFQVRVWHCVFTIDAHSRWTYRHRARMVPMRLFDASSRWQCFPATFVANTLCGAFPPLDLLAVCLVQAMVAFCCNDDGWKRCVFTSVRVMLVFFSFCQSGARALKISGHRSCTVIFVFLISIMSKSYFFS
jgi:hypothetical protein